MPSLLACYLIWYFLSEWPTSLNFFYYTLNVVWTLPSSLSGLLLNPTPQCKEHQPLQQFVGRCIFLPQSKFLNWSKQISCLLKFFNASMKTLKNLLFCFYRVENWKQWRISNSLLQSPISLNKITQTPWWSHYFSSTSWPGEEIHWHFLHCEGIHRTNAKLPYCWVQYGPQCNQCWCSSNSHNSLGSDLSICTVTTAKFNLFAPDFHSWNVSHCPHIGFPLWNSFWNVRTVCLNSFSITMGSKMYQAHWNYLHKCSLLHCSLPYQKCNIHKSANHLCFLFST